MARFDFAFTNNEDEITEKAPLQREEGRGCSIGINDEGESFNKSECQQRNFSRL